MKILVLNGPNLNMLGVREPDVYGKNTYADLCKMIKDHAKKKNVSITIKQTNCEGKLVTFIQKARNSFDAIVINPAAYTHTSVAILDAAKAVSLPMVEVHISDVTKREDFRQVSFIRSACQKTITGKGFQGYLEAIDYLLENK
ncbi:MAG: type II 3-dehydroquinate dehydratase [Clostridia bacterium]|nr:type II 3-dehydroquinate dehydratase [Clostridia bacterium]